jgi:hypothetical protein
MKRAAASRHISRARAGSRLQTWSVSASSNGLPGVARRLLWSERRQILIGLQSPGRVESLRQWRVSRAEPDAAAASRHYVRQELGAEAVARLESYKHETRHRLSPAGGCVFLALTAVLPILMPVLRSARQSTCDDAEPSVLRRGKFLCVEHHAATVG